MILLYRLLSIIMILVHEICIPTNILRILQAPRKRIKKSLQSTLSEGPMLSRTAWVATPSRQSVACERSACNGTADGDVLQTGRPNLREVGSGSLCGTYHSRVVDISQLCLAL